MKSTESKFVTVRRADRIEQDVINLQRSVEAMNELVCDLRARLLPVPANIYPPQQSPVVRNAVGIDL
jgi:hypothetical protein